jgi:N-acetyl-anhydromuramyl-L-alanine amidase AmpD
MICCHITEGAFDGTVSWITNPASQVSYHFVVARDGRIVQAVDIENMAWANGTNNSGGNVDNRHSTLSIVQRRAVNANLYTVSIGFEGRFAETQGALTTAQLEAAIWLFNHIKKELHRIYGTSDLAFRFNRNHIIGHNEITPRSKPNCPGRLFPFDDIIRLLNEDATAPTATEPLPAPAPSTQLPTGHTPSNWAREAWEWAFINGITDGTNPQNAPTREQMMQLLFNYHRFTQSAV